MERALATSLVTIKRVELFENEAKRLGILLSFCGVLFVQPHRYLEQP